VGHVRLEGQEDEGHGGVRIEAVAREFATVSTSEGRFTLPTPPGDYTIRFSAQGYETKAIPMVIVMDGQLRTLDDVLLQRDLSGQLKGQLQSLIAGYEWATAQVKLSNAGEERLGSPNNEGQFSFDLLQPGSYLLEVQAAGHVRYVEPILVRRDGQTELETINLAPAYLPMVGLAFLDDQQAQNNGVHQGIRVDSFVGDELVASTQTNESGRYQMMAGAIDYRLRFVRSGEPTAIVRSALSQPMMPGSPYPITRASCSRAYPVKSEARCGSPRTAPPNVCRPST
jgi:hypothetical protein